MPELRARRNVRLLMPMPWQNLLSDGRRAVSNEFHSAIALSRASRGEPAEQSVNFDFCGSGRESGTTKVQLWVLATHMRRIARQNTSLGGRGPADLRERALAMPAFLRASGPLRFLLGLPRGF